MMAIYCSKDFAELVLEESKKLLNSFLEIFFEEITSFDILHIWIGTKINVTSCPKISETDVFISFQYKEKKIYSDGQSNHDYSFQYAPSVIFIRFVLK